MALLHSSCTVYFVMLLSVYYTHARQFFWGGRRAEPSLLEKYFGSAVKKTTGTQLLI